jgi:hypothetical protein
MRKTSVCPEAASCRGFLFLESAIVAQPAVDRRPHEALDAAGPESPPAGFRTPRSSPCLRRWLPGWREHAPTQAVSSCGHTPCPPKSGPSPCDLRGPDDRRVSSMRDVRVFHKGNCPSSRFLLISLDRSTLVPFTNVLPRTHPVRHCWSRELFARASGTIPFSDSCLRVASHFARAYRVAYQLSPGCRQASWGHA